MQNSNTFKHYDFAMANFQVATAELVEAVRMLQDIANKTAFGALRRVALAQRDLYVELVESRIQAV